MGDLPPPILGVTTRSFERFLPKASEVNSKSRRPGPGRAGTDFDGHMAGCGAHSFRFIEPSSCGLHPERIKTQFAHSRPRLTHSK